MLPPDAPVRVFTFLEKDASGVRHPKEVSLRPQTADYQRLQAWLAQNQTGWSAILEPGGDGIFVHAGEVHLQFSGSTVTASTEAGPFTKEVREADYAFLEAALGI